MAHGSLLTARVTLHLSTEYAQMAMGAVAVTLGACSDCLLIQGGLKCNSRDYQSHTNMKPQAFFWSRKRQHLQGNQISNPSGNFPVNQETPAALGGQREP